MGKYSFTILSFFIFHNVVNTFDTLLAFIKGAGLLHCCHPFWAYLTIGIPFLPGFVGVPWFLWQVCHKRRDCGSVTWDIAKWLAFPLMMFVTNIQRLIRLFRLNSKYDPGGDSITMSPSEVIPLVRCGAFLLHFCCSLKAQNAAR